MKKYFTFGKIISFLLIIVVLYGVYAYFFKKSTDTTTVTINSTVRRGNIENSISAVGTAELINDQKIRFNQNGTIAKVNVKEGNHVKKGQVLTELDKKDLNNSIRQAQVSLSDAQVKLAQDLKPAEQKDVLSAQGNVLKSQSDLASAQSNLENLGVQRDNKLQDIRNQISAKQESIKTQQNQLVLAQSQLSLLTQQEAQNVNNVSIDAQKSINSAYTDMRKYLSNAQTYISNADDIFGFSNANRYKVISYDTFLSGKDPTLKSKASTDWNYSNNLLAKTNSDYNDIVNPSDSQSIQSMLNETKQLYNSLIILGGDAAEAIRQSVPADAYPQSRIDSDFATMNQMKSQSQTSFDAMNNSITNIQKLTDPNIQKQQSASNIAKQQQTISDLQIAIKNSQNDLNSLNSNLDATTKDYQNQIQQQQLNIKNIQNNIQTNQANLSFIQRGATSEQITLDKNSIAKAQISLSQAQSQIDKYQIVAPFDGTITQIDFKVGDNLSTQDNQEYVYINNPNLIQLTAQLDQIDVGKVKVGQKVMMQFDTFPNATFDGIISEIDPTPITTSGVTSYNIKITFDKGAYNIFSGMTAKINIIVSQKQDVLMIPTSFITKRRGVSYVTLDDGSTTGKSTEIVTGMSNATQTEVVSGLNEGDKILRQITIPKTSTSATTASGQRQGGGFGPGAGFGGGGGGFGGGGNGGFRNGGGGTTGGGRNGN